MEDFHEKNKHYIMLRYIGCHILFNTVDYF